MNETPAAMTHPAKKIPLRVCLGYALFGLAWILATDWVTASFTQDIRQIILYETIKGFVFVGFSATLLFW